MTRDDLARFAALPIDHEAIGLMEPGVPQEPYFCDPVGGEPVGRIGCDGVHFILLPGDERVFCVDPAMGEPGTYVLPVAEDLRQFLSFVLYCGDASPIAQIWWLSRPGLTRCWRRDGRQRGPSGTRRWKPSPPPSDWRVPTPMRKSRPSRPALTRPVCASPRNTMTSWA